MNKLFDYLIDLSGSASYGIIFGILVACGLGFPLPEDVPLIATGYLVWDGTMKWWPAFGVTMLGVLVGDTILFYIGRKLGLRILESGRVLKKEKVRRTRAYFRKYGDKLVFFARFVAGFRAAAFFLAGAMKMKYRRFVFYDGLAALLSVPIWIAIGYGMGHVFGDEIAQGLKKLEQFKNILSIAFLVIMVGVGVRMYIKYKKGKALKESHALVANRSK